jgi:cyclopropane-fatty-acyl-phospholipid synthase
MNAAKSRIKDLLESVDIRINGNRPWDIKVHNENLYRRIISKGSIGIGEAYMDGWWEHMTMNLPTLWLWIKSTIFNMQTVSRATKVAREHYNLGNELYMSFLDPYNQYTCGYFHNTHDLNEAQENKLELICQKLELKPTDRVLDIGCGWGGFAKYAAEKYGCHVTGISISDEQIKYAKDYCSGLPVEILKKDYRKMDGKYDKVLICGMIEHVGYKNYRTIMKKVRELLKPDGLFLLHTIGSRISHKATDPWLGKYIFPNSMTPSIAQLSRAAEELFIIEDIHNFGAHYAKTLLAWYDNFVENWSTIKHNYDDRFFRMWEYYLLSCTGFFASRTGQLWQIVLAPGGVHGGYKSIRHSMQESMSARF